MRSVSIRPCHRAPHGVLILLLLATLTEPVAAQPVPRPELGRQRDLEETRPTLPQFRAPPAPGLELPPVPPVEEERPLGRGPEVFVRRFTFIGNTVYSDDELAGVVAPYTGRTIRTEDLLRARNALTRHYVNAGYVNSGAVIPDQTVTDGVIEVVLVEGVLAEIEVLGLTSLDPSFVRDRIRLGADPPLDVDRLRERIQLLLRDPAVDRVDARLGPGPSQDESRLEIEVDEAPRYRWTARFANDRSPSIGAENAELVASFGNLLGRSDPLRLGLTVSEGLREVSGDYGVPLTARDLRLYFAGDQTESNVVEEPFNEIDIESESWSFEVGLSYPLLRTLDDEVLVSAGFERDRSTTFLLGRRFSFSEGVKDGRSDISALTFTQQWQHRTRDQVLAIRFSERLGLDLLGATTNPGEVPDGQFLTWLGQAQFARRLLDSDWQLNLRGDLQLTTDPLLPIERIAIGGLETVRGYRENQLVLDNGWTASAELRIPLGRVRLPVSGAAPDDGLIQLVPFVDAGGGWNLETPEPSVSTLYSVGSGLRWTLGPRFSARLDVGIALRDVPEPDDRDLQDLGIHFAFATALY